MKRFKIIFTALLAVYCSSYVNSQCNVIANASKLEIICGQPVILSHNGSTSGNISFSENFNNGAATGWAFTQQATFTNPCSPGGVDGTPHIWMGAQSGVPRSLETNPLDFSSSIAPLGGTICFDLLFAKQGGASPCEGPDEADEGVFLQYSIDNGASWVTIHYFNPNGGNDPQLINWNNWCFAIPAAALVNNVKFRWFQDADSGAAYDHWGIDNVQIIVNDPNVNYTWAHDGYTTNLPGNNPTAVSPRTTTTYSVTMTTSSGTCTNDITVVVRNPTVIVDAGSDLEVCPGECIQIPATATVINNPGGIKTFSNNQVEDFDASIISGASVNINIQELNMTNVNPGSIREVCISKLKFTGLGTSISGVETLKLTLECPGGARVVLVAQGQAPAGLPGTFPFIPPLGVAPQPSYYQNVCFVPAGGNDITLIPGGTPQAIPITGTYNSNEPFSNLDGCLANGTWSISVATNSFTGNGTFDGWSITFDDESLEYTPNVIWSPTTNMNPGDETTLTPTVCPIENTTYTITVSDTAGCVTLSDNVAITMGENCCPLVITNVQQINPTCAQTNGSFTVSVTGQTTGLKFSIDNGVTYQTGGTFSNLPAGTYTVLVEDDNGCPATRTISLNSNNAPSIDNTDLVHTTCTNNDGSITIHASGGAGALTYSVDNTTFQSGNLFDDLSAGTYTVTVKDDNGCTSTETVTINPGNVPVVSTTNTNPSCGNSDGAIAVNVTGGTAPYEYSIDQQNYSSSNTFTNLAPGTYTITVKDAAGCESTVTIALNTDQQPVINAGPDRTICIGDTVILAATGGVSYVWNPSSVTNGVAFVPGSTQTYIVTGTDANGCTGSATVIVTVLPRPDAVLNSDISSGDVPLTVTFTNQSTNATNYTWEFGNGSSPVHVNNTAGQTVTYTNPGNYTVLLSASNGYCVDTASVLIQVKGFPPFEMHVPNVFTPNGDDNNDFFFIQVSHAKEMHVDIFNRWGNKMFEINDADGKWDGKNATEGVYFFKYRIVDLFDVIHEGHGHVTLIRK